MAEKYEVLIDRKLELLEGLKMEHIERMEILKLERKIKEEELKKIIQGGNIGESTSVTVRRPIHGGIIDQQIGESVEFTL